MKWYKQKVFLLFLLSGCVEQKFTEIDEMNSLIGNYEDNIFNNQITGKKYKANDNQQSMKSSDKNSSIVITFEKDKSDLNHNQNTTAIDLFLSEIKTSDSIIIQATTSLDENQEIYQKRLKAVKEYLAKEIAVERIEELPNKKTSKEEDDLYSVICKIVLNA